MNVEVICNTLFGSTTNLIIPKNPLSKDAWIVDCGDSDKVIEKLEDCGRILRGIILTHGHFDHIYGINELLQQYSGCKVYTNEIGKEMLLDARKNMSHYYGTPITIFNSNKIKMIRDGVEMMFSEGLIAKAIFTPGHNPSCITWLIGDAIFTGDSYIPGIKTVTNLPGGNKIQAQKSLELITELKIGRIVYPGHSIESDV